jgi:hypothetical protein
MCQCKLKTPKEVIDYVSVYKTEDVNNNLRILGVLTDNEYFNDISINETLIGLYEAQEKDKVKSILNGITINPGENEYSALNEFCNKKFGCNAENEPNLFTKILDFLENKKPCECEQKTTTNISNKAFQTPTINTTFGAKSEDNSVILTGLVALFLIIIAIYFINK